MKSNLFNAWQRSFLSAALASIFFAIIISFSVRVEAYEATFRVAVKTRIELSQAVLKELSQYGKD